MSQVSSDQHTGRVRVPEQENSASTLIQKLKQHLQSSGHGDLRSVRILERDGKLRLEGSVRSFYVKQLAQILVGRELPGRIENAIEVA